MLSFRQFLTEITRKMRLYSCKNTKIASHCLDCFPTLHSIIHKYVFWLSSAGLPLHKIDTTVYVRHIEYDAATLCFVGMIFILTFRDTHSAAIPVKYGHWRRFWKKKRMKIIINHVPCHRLNYSHGKDHVRWLFFSLIRTGLDIIMQIFRWWCMGKLNVKATGSF